jgi:hypothetical protein
VAIQYILWGLTILLAVALWATVGPRQAKVAVRGDRHQQRSPADPDQ